MEIEGMKNGRKRKQTLVFIWLNTEDFKLDFFRTVWKKCLLSQPVAVENVFSWKLIQSRGFISVSLTKDLPPTNFCKRQ